MSIFDLVPPPLEFVLAEDGVVLEEQTKGELRYWCPFHEGASKATFALWKYNGAEFVRCFSCGFGPTGLIGYLMTTRGTSFRGAQVEQRRLAKEFERSDWTPTELPTRRERKQLKNFEPEFELTQSGNKEAARKFLAGRGLDARADWIIDEFRLGGDDKWIAVPHFTPDGKYCTAMKYRQADGLLLTLNDGVLAFLYGMWRDVGQPHVVVMEGESDTWRMAAYCRGRSDVLVVGLPHGACAPKLHWLQKLEGRDLTIFFDNDSKPPNAGQKAAAQWLAERPDARNVVPPVGRDASKLTDDEIYWLLKTSK